MVSRTLPLTLRANPSPGLEWVYPRSIILSRVPPDGLCTFGIALKRGFSCFVVTITFSLLSPNFIPTFHPPFVESPPSLSECAPAPPLVRCLSTSTSLNPRPLPPSAVSQPFRCSEARFSHSPFSTFSMFSILQYWLHFCLVSYSWTTSEMRIGQ